MKSCKNYLKNNIDKELKEINKIIEKLNQKKIKSEKIMIK